MCAYTGRMENQKPVRVLMVVRPAAGGMKEHVLVLARGLIARGHAVEIAAPATSDVAEAARAEGLVVHGIGLVGPLHPLADPRAAGELARIIRAGGFDVVHAHGFKAGFVGRLAAWRAGGRPIVVTVHNHVLSRTDTSAAARWRYRVVERALSGLVSRYIAVSDSIARELTAGFGLPAGKVVTIHNGIDTAPFLAPQDRVAARAALGVAEGAQVVGVAARFSAQKGLRHLVAAVPELVRRRPGIRVVIGGSGPLERSLREQAVALGVADAILWPGQIADMPRFLAALDVYVSPAETEAFGLGLIEAGAAGVPVVATRVGGVPEVVLDGDTGLLVAAGDPQALAAAVLALLGDAKTAARLAAAGRARAASSFSPERMVDATLAVYLDALGRVRP